MRWIRDKKGATAIEYGLIAAVVSVGILGSATTLKTSINDTYCSIASKMPSSQGGPCGGPQIPYEPSEEEKAIEAWYNQLRDESTPEYALAAAQYEKNKSECLSRPGFIEIEGSRGLTGSLSCGFRVSPSETNQGYGLPGISRT